MGDYTVFHDVAWHGANAAYFFLIGLSSALFFVSALSWFREEFLPVRRNAFYLSFGALVVSGLILVGDLSQPLRFMYTLNPAYWNMASPLVWGTILISLFGATSVWYLLVMGKDGGAGRPPAVLGSLLGLGLAIYSGFDLAVHQHRPVWNTPLMPVLFVALSLVSGAAVATFLARGEARLIGALRQVMLWGAAAAAVMLFSLLVATAYGGSAEELTYGFMTSGTLGMLFVGVGIVAGTLAPIAMLLAPFGRRPIGMMTASLLVLAGGLALRYSILMGPQIVQTYFS